MSALWGVPYLLIRVADRDLSPACVVFLRTSIAVLLLLPLAQRRQVSWRALAARWRPLVAYTVLEVTVPWWLLTWAETHLSSALSGLLVAAVPIFGVVMARLTRTADPVDARRLFGLLVGMGGVAALVGLQVGHIDLLAVAAVLGTALGYATGPLVLSRRLADQPAVGVIVASLALTALVWAAPAAATVPAHVSWRAAAAVVGLAVVCTAGAFVVFFALIAEVGPTRATVITYVNPAVAILLGVSLLGERFTVGMAIGFPLVLAGSALATRLPRSAQMA
jgi:drug/metabolite transporter (DMT)-like permease